MRRLVAAALTGVILVGVSACDIEEEAQSGYVFSTSMNRKAAQRVLDDPMGRVLPVDEPVRLTHWMGTTRVTDTGAIYEQMQFGQAVYAICAGVDVGAEECGLDPERPVLRQDTVGDKDLLIVKYPGASENADFGVLSEQEINEVEQYLKTVEFVDSEVPGWVVAYADLKD